MVFPPITYATTFPWARRAPKSHLLVSLAPSSRNQQSCGAREANAACSKSESEPSVRATTSKRSRGNDIRRCRDGRVLIRNRIYRSAAEPRRTQGVKLRGEVSEIIKISGSTEPIAKGVQAGGYRNLQKATAQAQLRSHSPWVTRRSDRAAPQFRRRYRLRGETELGVG
jgi:hypothetical protein